MFVQKIESFITSFQPNLNFGAIFNCFQMFEKIKNCAVDLNFVAIRNIPYVPDQWLT